MYIILPAEVVFGVFFVCFFFGFFFFFVFFLVVVVFLFLVVVVFFSSLLTGIQYCYLNKSLDLLMANAILKQN